MSATISTIAPNWDPAAASTSSPKYKPNTTRVGFILKGSGVGVFNLITPTPRIALRACRLLQLDNDQAQARVGELEGDLKQLLLQRQNFAALQRDFDFIMAGGGGVQPHGGGGANVAVQD